MNPPLFNFENEKKIRVCDQCFEKTELFFQETENLHLKRPLSNYWLDSTRKAELDTYLIDFLNRQFYQQAENVVNYCLQKHDLYDEWEQLVKSLVIDSIQTIKLSILERNAYDIRAFMKFKIHHYSAENKSKLIQGIVLTKNVAHKKMKQDIQFPTILMIKGNLEMHRSDEVFIMDENSVDREKSILGAISNNINKLRPSIIIVEGSVSREIQEMILNMSKTLVMKLRSSQFKKIARYTGAKPISDLSKIENLNYDPLGYCQRFSVNNNFNDEQVVAAEKSVLNPDIMNANSPLMIFDGWDPTKGATIVLNGPDKVKLSQLKACLKESLILLKNIHFEKDIIYQEIKLYHTKERLWRILTDIREEITFTSALQQDIREYLSLEHQQKKLVTEVLSSACIRNQSTKFTAGYKLHFLTEKTPLPILMDSTIIKFTKITLIPINLNSFPDLSKKGPEVLTQLAKTLRASNRWHKQEVSQLESEPSSVEVTYYGKNDASLGLFLINKTSGVFEKCVECHSAHFFHTNIFLIRSFYVKVTLEIRDRSKLKQAIAVKDSKMPKIRDDEKQVNIQNKQTSTAYTDSLHSNLCKKSVIASMYSKDKHEKDSFSENNISFLNTVMYIECSDCHNRLSEPLKLSQSYFDYSFSRYLEMMVSSAEHSFGTKLERKSSLEELLPDHSPLLKTSSSLKKSTVNTCCMNSVKNRVFVNDGLVVRFTVGFSNPMRLNQINSDNHHLKIVLARNNAEIIDKKATRLYEMLRDYLDISTAYLNEVITILAENQSIIINFDDPSNLEDLQLKKYFVYLLTELISLLQQAQGFRKEVELFKTQSFPSHLEIDLIRRNYFNKIFELCVSLEKVKKECSRLKQKEQQDQEKKEKSKLKEVLTLSNSTGAKGISDELSIDSDDNASHRSRKNTMEDSSILLMNKSRHTTAASESQEESDAQRLQKEFNLLDQLAEGINTTPQNFIQELPPFVINF